MKTGKGWHGDSAGHRAAKLKGFRAARKHAAGSLKGMKQSGASLLQRKTFLKMTKESLSKKYPYEQSMRKR